MHFSLRRPWIGAALGGAAAGAALSIVDSTGHINSFAMCRAVFSFTIPWYASMGLFIYLGIRRPIWLRNNWRAWTLYVARVFGFGFLGGCCSFFFQYQYPTLQNLLWTANPWDQPYSWSLQAVAWIFGVQHGGPLALGLALAQLPLLLSSSKGSQVLFVLLAPLGGILGLLPYWSIRITEWLSGSTPLMPAVLLDGALFGLCFALGTVAFRPAEVASRSSPTGAD